MTKRRPRVHLWFALLMITLLSFVTAAAAFAGMNAAGDALIRKRIYTREKIYAREEEYLSELLADMSENNYGFSDRERIQQWVRERKNLMLAVYDASNLYRQDSSGVLYAGVSDALSMYDLLQDQYSEYWYTCLISTGRSSMRSRMVKVMYYPMYRARDIAVVIEVAAAFLLFVAMLLLCIRRKTRYIELLSRQLQVMQGGELSAPMTIRGRDELTTLAEDIEEMRKSFIERLAHEEEMTKNASELLTAMSHDLRTPLTSLIGYLDIIDLGKCHSPEQVQKYVHSGKQKAYQIKEMTDKLFEYFLVYSENDKPVEKERLDAATLFTQLWSESALSLETEGFHVDMRAEESTCEVLANVPLLRRVFDNLVSNVRKYADPAQPVEAEMRACEGGYRVEERNTVADVPRGESSGIGIASCKKIMEGHGGSFEIEKQGSQCVCRLFIPAAPADALPVGTGGKALSESEHEEAASAPIHSPEEVSKGSNEKNGGVNRAYRRVTPAERGFRLSPESSAREIHRNPTRAIRVRPRAPNGAAFSPRPARHRRFGQWRPASTRSESGRRSRSGGRSRRTR